MSAARLAPPWYVHPAAAPRDWAWLAAQRRKLSFAVVNVHNGPGEDDDAYYPGALPPLRGIRLVGYVPVGFGDRAVADVVHDIETWRRRYGIDAIMLDELPSSAASLTRCAQYAAAARTAGVTFLVANPGVFPSLAHLNLFDVTGVFEGTAETYATFEHPPWTRHVPPSALWHLVYGCAAEQIAVVERDAARRGAGHVFVTDRSMPNPWLGPPIAASTRRAAVHRLGLRMPDARRPGRTAH